MSCYVYSMCVVYVPQVTDFEKRYFGSIRDVVANVGQIILRAIAHNSCSASIADGLNFTAVTCRCRQIYVRLDLKPRKEVWRETAVKLECDMLRTG